VGPGAGSMTEKRPSPSSEEGIPSDFVKYTFFHLRPEWRRLPASERGPGREAFASVLEHPPDGLLVRTYSLVGLKAGTELLVWSIGPRLEGIQELHARLAGTALGGYLETAYSYLGLGRRSEYLGEHAHGGEGGSGRRRPEDQPYLFVYPFVKKREWYGLPLEERKRVMGEHFRIGHRYPHVRIHTGYSFGLDDMEFILAFEGESPREFLELVHDLRPSEASRYTALETPIFTCLLATPRRALELAEGVS
jgi:chlorite dismutase